MDLAASIPGLDLDIDGNVRSNLGYQFQFGFGFHKTELDSTSTPQGALPSGEEFAFSGFSRVLANNFEASGRSVTFDPSGGRIGQSAGHHDRNSGLYGSFGVDIREPDW